MSIGRARNLLYGAVLAGWRAHVDELRYPVVFDNETGAGQDTSGGYLQVLVRHGGSEQITLGPDGARRWVRNGLCFGNVRVPLDSNMAEGDRLAEVVRSALEGKTLTDPEPPALNVWTFASDIQEQGPSTGLYWIVVETPFQYEVTR